MGLWTAKPSRFVTSMNSKKENSEFAESFSRMEITEPYEAPSVDYFA
jgi:hypothetical protein